MQQEAEKRFVDGHYLGLPAEYNNRFIQNRFSLLKAIPGFFDNSLNLIEIGCGNGNTLLLVAPYFANVTGIDIFPENQQMTLENAKKLGITNLEVKLIDFENEGISGKYDRLLCFEVIEHFKDENSVKKFKNFLKPDAQICISVPHKWWIFETHGARLPLLPWNRVPFFSWLPRRIHERYANARIYTRKRIVRLLTEAGFTVLDVKMMTAPLDFLKIKWLRNILQKTLFRNITTRCPFKATNIFVHAILKN